MAALPFIISKAEKSLCARWQERIERKEKTHIHIQHSAKLFYKTASIFSLNSAYKFDCALIEKVLLNTRARQKASAVDVTGSVELMAGIGRERARESETLLILIASISELRNYGLKRRSEIEKKEQSMVRKSVVNKWSFYSPLLLFNEIINKWLLTLLCIVRHEIRCRSMQNTR